MIKRNKSKRGAYAYAVALAVAFIGVILIVYVFPDVKDFLLQLAHSGSN